MQRRPIKKFTLCGGYGLGVPPVPIPNTEVKPQHADGTWLETARESRSLPHFIFLSSSMAEHSAVNRRVVGSSPTWGAIGLDILAISNPFFVGNKVPYARLTPSFESGYLNEKHMQTTRIDKSP